MRYLLTPQLMLLHNMLSNNILFNNKTLGNQPPVTTDILHVDIYKDIYTTISEL